MSEPRKDTIEVIVNEEYGYRAWLWKPNMTETEFISWWESLTETDIIKFYFNIRSVVGTIEPMAVEKISTNINDHPYYCHMHDVDDSYIVINKTRYDFRRTTRRDWKNHWIDWVLKNQPEANV